MIDTLGWVVLTIAAYGTGMLIGYDMGREKQKQIQARIIARLTRNV